MTITVGVGTTTEAVSVDAARALANALDVQVKQHLKPIWEIDAEVVFLQNVGSPPKGMHPIFITDETPNDVAGFHRIQSGITFAFVNRHRNWQLAASHECLEMLVDPTGQKLIPSIGIGIVDGAVQDIDDEFHYFLEVCDPMEDEAQAYEIAGIPVSDFYTPAYFDREFKAGTQYSFRDTITRPRQVLPGGYVSWWHPKTQTLHQIRDIDGLKQVDLPPWSPNSDVSARMFIDGNTLTPRSRPDLFSQPPARSTGTRAASSHRYRPSSGPT